MTCLLPFRYWEAISRWDQALEITPLNEKLYEMKSQVLMELGEIHPALESAEKSAKIKPIWAEAFQTLGRAQLNVGEIHLVKCLFNLLAGSTIIYLFIQDFLLPAILTLYLSLILLYTSYIQALKSFARAKHLNPSNPEVFNSVFFFEPGTYIIFVASNTSDPPFSGVVILNLNYLLLLLNLLQKRQSKTP